MPRFAPLALILLLAASLPAAAQHAVSMTTFAAEAGPSFPTGGDFNDVYKIGYHAGVSAERPVAGALAVRASTDYDVFGHDTIKPQYGEDREWGRSFYTTVDGVLRGRRRVYLLGGVGYYRVHAAFLALSGHVLPASTQQAFGLDGGVGVRLGGSWELEVRHHDALRRREGLARWIPLSLRHAI